MPLLKNDPKATDSAYINLQKDHDWFDPPDLLKQHVEELFSTVSSILDKKFPEQCKHNFHSCYAEMYVAATLQDRCGLVVTHPSDKGPDFFLEGLNCWVEVVSVTDGEEGKPNSVPKMVSGKARSYPEDKVILRLTGAFKTKADKMRADIEKGIIDESQPIIICISGGAMEECRPMYPVGGYPQILKALLPIGEQVLWIGLETRDVVSIEYKYREGINKITDSGEDLINTESFLNDEYSHISAVIYSWANAANPTERKQWGSDFFIVHNPKAKNPLSIGSIKCGQEYSISVSNDSFTLKPPIEHEKS